MRREDRRALDEIEERLVAEAPSLATQLATGSIETRALGWGVGAWLWSCTALVLVVASASLGEVLAAMQAGFCAAALIGLRQWEITAQ
ncbi:DUF3040 domain-containing protein [Allosaccharopolyspora coralli]|uniref:DUF3040 domain-containing protein n=1 Tax=Allosaccharopolyspora coralli TaxID=2665642 RepID=UPI0016520770|nr:DUF3040 domain-containing protein [Allosaccharopolyspora coralli]